MSTLQQIQQTIGVEPVGIWGPKSQAALIAASDSIKAQVQGLLGVTRDGIWGVKSQNALNALGFTGGPFECDASSFADPSDVAAFLRCKSTGKTDLQCFRVGDNGIGQFGRITAQEHTAMIAVHGDEMKRRWGSIAAAAHRPVVVWVKGQMIHATVEDRISAPGRIDLNPACAKLFGLKPPFVVPCRWAWAD